MMTSPSTDWKIKTTVTEEIPTDTALLKQVHGKVFVQADDVEPGQGTEGDAIILPVTNSRKIGIRTADCLPLILMTNDKAIALHVSRKTLIAGQLDEVPNFIDTSNITRVHIGPHICEKHFNFPEQGPEVIDFMEKFPKAYSNRSGHVHLSVRQAVQNYLKEWQVAEEIIEEDARCTRDTPELSSYKQSLEEGAPLKHHLLTTVARASL